MGIDKSLDEVFRIAREARLPAEIYHLKVSGKASWGTMPHVLQRIEAARAEGLDVSADQYPWTASSNALSASLPAWAREGGRDEAGGPAPGPRGPRPPAAPRCPRTSRPGPASPATS